MHVGRKQQRGEQRERAASSGERGKVQSIHGITPETKG